MVDTNIICWLLMLLVQAFCQEDITGNGTASQSSDYWHEINDWGHYHLPSVAQTGESHVWVDSRYTYSCSATKLERTTAWWMLSFEDMKFFTGVKIYYRENFADRLAGFSIYITNSTKVTDPPTGYLCYRHKGPELPNVYQDINCHYLGKNLIIYNNRTDGIGNYDKISSMAILELCGVKVYGCPKGKSGGFCNNTCPTNCLGQHCFPENNTCVWGCDWKKCKYEICNKDDGTCTEGCLEWIKGNFCKVLPVPTTDSYPDTTLQIDSINETISKSTVSKKISKTKNLGAVVGGSISAGLIALIIVGVLGYFIVKRMRSKGDDSCESNGNKSEKMKANNEYPEQHYNRLNDQKHNKSTNPNDTLPPPLPPHNQFDNEAYDIDE